MAFKYNDRSFELFSKSVKISQNFQHLYQRAMVSLVRTEVSEELPLEFPIRIKVNALSAWKANAIIVGWIISAVSQSHTSASSCSGVFIGFTHVNVISKPARDIGAGRSDCLRAGAPTLPYASCHLSFLQYLGNRARFCVAHGNNVSHVERVGFSGETWNEVQKNVYLFLILLYSVLKIPKNNSGEIMRTQIEIIFGTS